jgi:hypothetical protein
MADDGYPFVAYQLISHQPFFISHPAPAVVAFFQHAAPRVKGF